MNRTALAIYTDVKFPCVTADCSHPQRVQSYRADDCSVSEYM